jgi:V/A-type H+-transporting ATPase subunit E
LAETKLYEKIVEKGKAEADAIIAQGKAKADQVAAEIIAAARAEAEKIVAEASRRAEDRLKTKTIEFEQQARHQLLKAKKGMIDRVLAAAVARLKELPDKQFVELTVKLLRWEAVAGDEIVRVSAAEFLRYRKLFCSNSDKADYYDLDKLNALLGPAFRLRLSTEPVDIDGGFVLVGRDYDIDLSYEAVLASVKERHEPEIARLLFRAEE